MTTDSSLKAIFRMSWYDSPRHRKSHTDMYYLKQHHTYWGFDDPLCRIQLIQVRTDTDKYYSALMNSHLADLKPSDKPEMREIIETLAVSIVNAVLNFYYLWRFVTPIIRVILKVSEVGYSFGIG